ncbi:hypothetical protein F5146DRAFT_1142207 [Armillaria mellea]|nr:hypothetical protein F5146DRAFT_1142207 [Armillaria mellea]
MFVILSDPTLHHKDINFESSRKVSTSNEATHVASHYFLSKPVSANADEEQRAHSGTFIVPLKNGTEAIIKLRDTEIDLSRVALAHSILGDITPQVHSGKVRKANFAHAGQVIPGTPSDIEKTSYQDIVTISADLTHPHEALVAY